MTLKLTIGAIVDTTSKERLEQEVKEFLENELAVDEGEYQIVIEDE